MPRQMDGMRLRTGVNEQRYRWNGPWTDVDMSEPTFEAQGMRMTELGSRQEPGSVHDVPGSLRVC